MLPRSVPCYKVFYQGDDGLLHTKYGDATVSVGGRLMAEGGALHMRRRGINFYVTVEDCLSYYTKEEWKGKRRVVAQVAPLSDECLFEVNKYCTRGVEVVRLLEEGEKPCLLAAMAAAGADPSSDDNLAILWASKYGRADVVRLLLADPRVDPGARNNFAIRLASIYGHAEVARLLLYDPRVDPSTCDDFAIQQASRYGYADVVRLLLADPRVDPGANDNCAVGWASEYSHADVVLLLLDDPRVRLAPGASDDVVDLHLTDPRVRLAPSADDNDAIRWASRNGHAEVVDLLLADPCVRLGEQMY